MSEVIVTRWIAASPPTVFAFFTDSERWAAWQGVGGTVDARAGGTLRVIMPDAAAASGQFIEVIPPRRIVFTWGWEGNRIPVPPGSSTVTIELEPADDGTLLRLTHSGLEATDIQELHRKGWERYLDRLARRTTGEDPGPDRYNDSSAPRPGHNGGGRGPSRALRRLRHLRGTNANHHSRTRQSAPGHPQRGGAGRADTSIPRLAAAGRSLG